MRDVSRHIIPVLALIALVALTTCGKDSPTKPAAPEPPPPATPCAAAPGARTYSDYDHPIIGYAQLRRADHALNGECLRSE